MANQEEAPLDSSLFSVEPSYYQTLELDFSASTQDIKAAWKRLSQLYHPDKNESDTTDKFKSLVEAYATLRDPKLRDEYDSKLHHSHEETRHFDRLPKKMNPPIVRASGAKVIVEWSVASDETEQVESFVLELKQDGYRLQQAYEGTASRISISGLTHDWIYHFRVRAINALGAGEHSEWTQHSSSSLPPSDDSLSTEKSFSTKTQDFVSDLHVAISSHDILRIEELLEVAAESHSLDLHQFWSLLNLASHTVALSPPPPHVYTPIHHAWPSSQHPPLRGPHSPTRTPLRTSLPKSLL